MTEHDLSSSSIPRMEHGAEIRAFSKKATAPVELDKRASKTFEGLKQALISADSMAHKVWNPAVEDSTQQNLQNRILEARDHISSSQETLAKHLD